MTSCRYALGSWATANDLPARCRPEESEVSEEIVQALADATDIMFLLSGQKFPGLCSTTVRPCGRTIRAEPNHVHLHAAALTVGAWGDRRWSGLCSCNQSVGQCGCSYLSEVSLGVFPIEEVTKVMVDGDELDPSLYRVDDWKYLVRLPDPDGTKQGWPCCQDMSLPVTEEGTFEVSVTYGSLPDGAGRRAAAALACQLLKSRTGESCDLPEQVRSINRQGVSMDINAVVNLLDTGGTGVAEADRWLKAVNPTGQTRPGGVLIPGARSSVRRVGT